MAGWEWAIPAALLAAFPLIEWVVHVVVLHWRPRDLGPLRVDSLLARKHRAHHADPRDLPLVFIPTPVLAWLLPAYVLLAWALMPTTSSAFTLLVSVYAIMAGYEWVHYLVHSDYRPRSRWFRHVWRNHRLHHYKNEHYWFGVATAGTADRLLRTYPTPADVATSPTVRALHGSTRLRRVIHHLNCATLRPIGSFGGRVAPPRIVAHCLLIERPDGLTLVDTGFGRDDIAAPRRLGRPFVAALRPVARPRRDRRRAGGRPGSPDRVTSPTSCSPTSTSTTPVASRTSRARGSTSTAPSWTPRCTPRCASGPATCQGQWAHGPQWVRHDVAGDDWLGFEAVTALTDDVLLVPLHGHTRGHCGVAVRRHDGGWLLHAGDAYFDAGEKETPPHAAPGLRFFQRLMAVDDGAAGRQPGPAARAARRALGRGHHLQRPRRHGVRRPRG